MGFVYSRQKAITKTNRTSSNTSKTLQSSTKDKQAYLINEY